MEVLLIEEENSDAISFAFFCVDQINKNITYVRALQLYGSVVSNLIDNFIFISSEFLLIFLLFYDGFPI